MQKSDIQSLKKKANIKSGGDKSQKNGKI